MFTEVTEGLTATIFRAETALFMKISNLPGYNA
jgi:hypothetical protein